MYELKREKVVLTELISGSWRVSRGFPWHSQGMPLHFIMQKREYSGNVVTSLVGATETLYRLVRFLCLSS